MSATAVALPLHTKGFVTLFMMTRRPAALQMLQ
jgi:hypothetical protein